MRIVRFEEIQSWKEAKILTVEIYKLTRQGAFSRDFGLRDQIRKAGISIMANIAEGFGRRTNKEVSQFLGIANGSALEVYSHLHIAHELEYISSAQFDRLSGQAHSVSRLIGGFIHYLERSTYTRNKKPETRNQKHDIKT